MTMHLAPAYLTTTASNTRKKKSNSAKKAAADAKHNEWLAKQGLLPNQIKMKKAFVGNVRNSKPDYTLDCNTAKLSNNLKVAGGFKKDIITNLHKESPEVQKEILAKAARTAPAYNKGAVQYITPGADLTDLGKKK